MWRSAAADPLPAGGTDIYTIDVTNAGPSDAVGVVLADTFSSLKNVSYSSSDLYAPAGSSPATASSPSGSLSAPGPALSESLNLPAGASIQFIITGTLAAGAPGTLTNTVAPPPIRRGQTIPFRRTPAAAMSRRR